MAWLSDPLLLVTVAVSLPATPLAPAVIVSVLVPDPVTVVGLNAPVTPVGSPVTPKLTTPLNPLLGVTVTVYVVLLPSATVRVPGVMLSA